MAYIFGPVPSRRLGRSLGIDVVPTKTCSFDCIYCESGPTTHLTLEREPFADPAEVLEELHDFFRQFPNGTDVLTFSSAGEPTLYSRIGELISAIKEAYPRFPLIVLTNGSLLWDPQVRKDLLQADRVVPSLDAVTTPVFREINKPHPSLDLALIVEGIRAFRREYKGQLHVEIVLASGINDSPEELTALARMVEHIGPDKVELNTVVRPPAVMGTRGLSQEEMLRAAAFFNAMNVEIVGTFDAPREVSGEEEDIGLRILQTIARRPCTVSELAVSLGVPESKLEPISKKLEEEKKLSLLTYDGKQFLSSAKG